MAKIKSIEANEVLNAKGFPTVEVVAVLSDGKTGKASCPTGESEDHDETLGLKDNNNVAKAIGNIKNIIASALIGKEAEHQPEIDKIMIDLDGTQDKSRLGKNAIFAVSLAVARAAAKSLSIPLFLHLRHFVKNQTFALKIPTPIFNLLNGKRKNDLSDFNEFLVIPASSKSYLESIRIGEEITRSLKDTIKTQFAKPPDEYDHGIFLDLSTNKDGFTLIQQAIGGTSLNLGFDIFLGLNSKASNFFKDGKYHIKDSTSPLSAKELIDFYDGLNREMHFLYLEDALDKDDWEGWTQLFEKLSPTTVIAGGDLIATNLFKLQMAIDKKAANAIVVKPNQIGTVIESLAIAEAAKETNFSLVVSHRSNETNDDFIADFSVATGADYIKMGSLSGGENIAKYNRLLQIDNQLKIL
jgi:enolase